MTPAKEVDTDSKIGSLGSRSGFDQLFSSRRNNSFLALARNDLKSCQAGSADSDGAFSENFLNESIKREKHILREQSMAKRFSNILRETIEAENESQSRKSSILEAISEFSNTAT